MLQEQQTIFAPPLIRRSACNNSFSSIPFTLLVSKPPCPIALSTSSQTSFSSTQSRHALDSTQSSARVSIHQRFTLSSSSTPQFTALPYSIIEGVHAFHPFTPSSITTFNETRDIHNPPLHPHANPYNPEVTQLYMREIDYQFQNSALD